MSVPNAPTNVSVQSILYYSARIGWDIPNVTNLIGYRITANPGNITQIVL